MRAVMRQVPDGWLEERARLGHDRWDEIWDGVLHMVPPPSFVHQRLGARLVAFLLPRLGARGVDVLYETGVFQPASGGKDYRVPDLVFIATDAPAGLVTERGIEGAPLCVAELRSDDDESYEKLPFYAALGVREVIVVDPTAATVEVFRLAGSSYLAVSADEHGRVHASTIDARFHVAAGALHARCAGDAIEIPLTLHR